jgi:3-methyl-2-oxobutanoate hydroxymethyltransferase
MKTSSDLKAMKGISRIAMITAYDACFARIAEAAGIDMILVGDSAANVVLGYSSTRDIGMDEMLIFVGAVRRGAPNTHVVADMPWHSDIDVPTAIYNARRFMDAGANSVKIEGAQIEILCALQKEGIPVVGHVGLLPQTATSFKQAGQSPEEAERTLQEAIVFAQFGAFAIVIEHVPDSLGSLVAQRISDIPIIGIGAGNSVDGQVLVLHDALGMHPFRQPPFAKKFAEIYVQGVDALRRYVEFVNK